MFQNIPFKRFQPATTNYQVEALARKEVQELKDFVDYYEITGVFMHEDIAATIEKELQLVAPWYTGEHPEPNVHSLLSTHKEPENDAEQLCLNLLSIIRNMPISKEEISMSYLQKLQAEIHQKLHIDNIGPSLRLESNSLFGSLPDVNKNEFLSPESKLWLDDLFLMVKSKEISPWVRAAAFWYYFNLINPFTEYNRILAYLVCKKILTEEKLDIFNMIAPVKYFFQDVSFEKISKSLSEIPTLLEAFQTDLTEYTEVFISCFRKNILAIRIAVTNVVREQLDYQSLTPRQKNSLNFWLEKAFYTHKEKLSQLSPRQHEMMLLIAKYGSLSNKDLVPVFQVDRKTIQRDFNTLLDLKLLDQRGGGRALKYYINLRVEI